MKYTEILESADDKITLANGKTVKDDEKTIKKLLTSGEFLFAKHDGETIRFGEDEEDAGNFFVAGRSPKSFKDFDNFKSAYKYWSGKYRK